MSNFQLVRDYENASLPINIRVPSLAKRFTCLRDAKGIEPWSKDEFYAWLSDRGKGTCEWHAGHLILNLMGDGPWESFDAIGAVSVWNEADRGLFAAWARSWK